MSLRRLAFTGHVFYDIIPLLDKLQFQHKKNLIMSDKVKRALVIVDCVAPLCESWYLSVYGGFSYKFSEYKSRCTRITFTPKGGEISWIDAPTDFYGSKHPFVLTIIDTLESEKVVKFLKSFQVRENNSVGLILTARE